MKVYICLCLGIIFSTSSFACRNQLPESEVIKALNLEPNAGSKSCADLPEEKCVCYDGIDWRDAELIDGELVHNSDKAFARELAEENAEKARKEKEEKCKNFSFKGTTIAQLRTELNEWVGECKK